MELKEEIELLEKKVALLKQVQELQEMIGKMEKQPVYIPQPYPVYPGPCLPWEPSSPWIIYCGAAIGGESR